MTVLLPLIAGAHGHTPVRVISLADDGARRSAFSAAAADASGHWAFFDAATALPADVRVDQAGARRYWGRELTPGEIGCFGSHLALWRWILEGDVEQAVVLEDDVVVDWSFLALLGRVDFGRLGVDYLRLFAKVPCAHEVVASPFVEQYRHLIRFRGFPLGTQGYVLTRSGASKLLATLRAVRVPVDVYLDQVWVHGVENFAIYPFPLFERLRPSTIGEARFRSSGSASAEGGRELVRRALRRLEREYCRYRIAVPGTRALRRLAGAQVNPAPSGARSTL